MESPTVLPAGGVGTRTRWRWVLFCVFLFGVILLPFALFDGRMNVLVQDSLQSGTSLTLITLAVIGFLTVDVALPIPSSFVLSTTGYLLGIAAGTAVCFLGMSVSSAIGYWLGHFAGRPLARRLIGTRGLRDFNALVHRYGDATLVAFRAMPVLAEATLLVAGLSHMKFARFMTIVSLGNLIVSALYAWIGAVSADRSSFLFASVASIVVPTIIVILTRQVAARRPRAGEEDRTDVEEEDRVDA